jgi:hypothetical protein
MRKNRSIGFIGPSVDFVVKDLSGANEPMNR